MDDAMPTHTASKSHACRCIVRIVKDDPSVEMLLV